MLYLTNLKRLSIDCMTSIFQKQEIILFGVDIVNKILILYFGNGLN